MLATISGGVATYHHPDHLSNRAETDSSGNPTRAYGHFPFGETWYEAGAPDKWKFTSYARDTGETNLDYANFRHYASLLGRYASPDFLAGNLLNPQSLNRYAYVLNNPVSLVDPLGLDPCPGDPRCPSNPGNEGRFGPGNDGPSDQRDPSGGSGGAGNRKTTRDPGENGGGGGGGNSNSGPDCTLNIKINNNANLTEGQITAIQNQITALFATSGTGAASNVGVNFVSSGQDYTLNINDAGVGHTDDGHQTSFLWFQFSPVIHPNNIKHIFSQLSTDNVNTIMGGIGAHELVHRITGVGDLPYDPLHPNDIMGSNHNPDNYNKWKDNEYQLTDKEIQKLLQECLKKHPKQ